MLKLHVLASGSKGNVAIIENAETGAVNVVYRRSESGYGVLIPE